MRLIRHLVDEASKDASRTTVLQEGLHCVGFGMTQILKKKALKIEDMENASAFSESYIKFCDIDAGEQDLWKFKEEQPSWTASVVKAVNAVKSSGWLKGNGYKFYRGKTLMNQIYEHFNKLKAIDGIKLANDKWNPSDIWASKISVIPTFDNLTGLNEFISDKLKKRTLVGISLKKVGGSAKVVWQGSVEKPEIVGYEIIKKPKEIFPTGMVIDTTKDKIFINFRSFRISKQADIGGEIVMQGGAARHGKVPSSVKKNMVEKYKIPQILKGRLKSIVDADGTDDLVKMVIELWKQCGYTFSEGKIKSDWQIRVKKGMQDEVGYWQSIIHALELGAFLNTHKGVAQDIVHNFYIGASSAGGLSSEFIKVY